MKFPIYEMRSFVRKYEEGMYVIIETNRGRWTFDHKYNTGKNFWERRLELLKDPFLPYDIYPLKKLYTTLSQLVNSKARMFVDSEGVIRKYVPSTFYKIKYEKIAAKWKTSKDLTAFKTLQCPTTFISYDNNYTHLGYIQKGREFILYDLCYELKPDTRKKV